MSTLAPMLVTPANDLPVGDWAYELKWDGMRALVEVDGGQVRITSRKRRQHADTFPELAGLVDAWGDRSVLLDGEIVCMGDDGKPSFERLGLRLVNSKKSRYWVHHVPATFIAFDLLALDGTDLCAHPWHERHKALVDLGLDQLPGPWQVNPVYDDGAALFEITGDMGLEGVVAKHRRSPYRPGIRSRWWVKCKNTQRAWLDVLGWQPPGRSTPGGLIVGDEGGPAGLAILALPAPEKYALIDLIHRYGEAHRDRLYVPAGALQADVTYLERTPMGRIRHAVARAVRPSPAYQ